MLLDCGLFQGRRQQAADINSHLALTPQQLAVGGLNAVVLSHAHIDHSGDLPLLVKQGYRGPIYTTPATIDLCAPMLKDSAHIQESDAEFISKLRGRRSSIGAPPGPAPMPPLYTQDDAAQVSQQFLPVKLHEPQLLAGSTKDAGFTMTSSNAGHMLGSTNVLIDAIEKGQKTRLLFSGDVGRKNLPIIRDPDPAPAADYLIMESTYGDRLHHSGGDVKQKIADIVKRVTARGGHIIVPAFAVERTQQLVLAAARTHRREADRRASHLRGQPARRGRHRRLPQAHRRVGPGARRIYRQGRGPLRLEAPALHPDGGGEQGAERSARAVHRDVGLGHVRGRAASCTT